MNPYDLALLQVCSACREMKPRVAFKAGRSLCRTCQRKGWFPPQYLEPIEPVSTPRLGSPPWTYPLTTHQHRVLRHAQRGICPVCQREDRRMVVDHVHDETGYVRGLLCSECNVGLGMFQDNPERLRRAASYLEHPVLPIRQQDPDTPDVPSLPPRR